MKSGVRTVGVAESYDGDRSTLAAAVVRADRTVDGLAFETCTVGGGDATESIRSLLQILDREDVRALLLSGIAPAWFNMLDLESIAADIEYPVISVSFEASEGLEPALRREFSGEAGEWRLAVYERQPPREELSLNDETVFIRTVDIDVTDAHELLRTVTPEGGRPEPLRVARLAARAADRFRREARHEDS